jgi:hypothetical protein
MTVSHASAALRWSGDLVTDATCRATTPYPPTSSAPSSRCCTRRYDRTSTGLVGSQIDEAKAADAPARTDGYVRDLPGGAVSAFLTSLRPPRCGLV